MNIFTINNFSFAYPSQSEYVLKNISLNIEQGQLITLFGKSGCGKSTLLHCLKPILAPHGRRDGTIKFYGFDIDLLSQAEQAKKIGFVAQNPDNSLVTDKVWHELVFGLESLSMPKEEIRIRAAETASFFGIQTWFHKNVSELSGGQKQLLNLASVMIMQPDVLILDEPTSSLDPIAAHDFLETVSKINRETGITVILAEHNLNDAFPISDRIIVMEDGKIIADDIPKNIGKIISDNDMYDAMPAPVRVFMSVNSQGECPITVCEGRKWLESQPNIKKDISFDETVLSSPIAAELKNVWFRYEKNQPDIIKGLSAKIHQGELYAIVGGNGTGKTTALSLISGINKPYRGRIVTDGKIAALPQNPQSLFIKNTVFDDLSEVSDNEKLIDRISKLCEISHLLDRHPYDLSGGEQQRAALAKILLTEPQIILLDEPTKGLDAHFKIKLAEILKSLDAAIIMVSHDIEFCAEYADRCAMFFDGAIISDEPPRRFFSGKSFYTTSADRMARNIIPNAVLTEDIISALGGKIPSRKTSEPIKIPIPKKPIPEKRQKRKNGVIPMLISVILILFTALAGVFWLDDRKYYIISMLIIPETLIPFALSFEKRRPQASELAVLSVMCAIAVAGRGAFYMLPQFKPMAAVTIITGICFGGESGFLVGAMCMLVSNFLFGQGPWTPWQMLAMGLIGFVSGAFYGLKKRKLPLCIFGALATVIIYGGIMNPASVIMYQENPNIKMFLSYYISGFPFDVIHGCSTAIFLYFISMPMIEKADRIKMKYGIFGGTA